MTTPTQITSSSLATNPGQMPPQTPKKWRPFRTLPSESPLAKTTQRTIDLNVKTSAAATSIFNTMSSSVISPSKKRHNQTVALPSPPAPQSLEAAKKKGTIASSDSTSPMQLNFEPNSSNNSTGKSLHTAAAASVAPTLQSFTPIKRLKANRFASTLSSVALKNPKMQLPGNMTAASANSSSADSAQSSSPKSTNSLLPSAGFFDDDLSLIPPEIIGFSSTSSSAAFMQTTAAVTPTSLKANNETASSSSDLLDRDYDLLKPAMSGFSSTPSFHHFSPSEGTPKHTLNTKTQETARRAFTTTSYSPQTGVQFSSIGLVLPDFSGMSATIPMSSLTPTQPTSLKKQASSSMNTAAASSSDSVPPNELILTRASTATPVAPDIKTTNTIRKRIQGYRTSQDPLRIQLLETLVAITNKKTFTLNGVTYTKLYSLGKGQFVETFETDKAGIVIKHLHEKAIFYDAFGNPQKYWEGVKMNYLACQSIDLTDGRKPVANILNAETLVDQMFALQEKVIPLDNLTKEHLQTFSLPIFPQIKEIIGTFFKQGLVIEAHKKNLGIALSSRRVVLYDTDDRAEFDEDENNEQNSLLYNLRENLASYGPTAASYLDPRIGK